jgi:hypothetical protein
MTRPEVRIGILSGISCKVRIARFWTLEQSYSTWTKIKLTCWWDLTTPRGFSCVEKSCFCHNTCINISLGVIFVNEGFFTGRFLSPHLGKCVCVCVYIYTHTHTHTHTHIYIYIYYWCIHLPTYQDVIVPACTSEANFAWARGSERRSCMTAVPSGYTSHQGNPVTRPELQPFQSFISSRRYVTSATAPLTHVTAAVAVKNFWLFSVVFLFGFRFISCCFLFFL